ncbi:MAG: carbohydrate porin [Dongiaceae bacterium]
MSIQTVRRAAAGLALMLAAGVAAPAHADDQDWFHSEGLTGEWGGLRDQLDEMGIKPRAELTSEMAGNPVGGQRQGFRYAQELDFGVDLDLDKLAGLTGTEFHLTFTQYSGHSLSEDRIGNIFSVQEIFDGEADFRISELSIEQTLFDDHLNLKVGRIGAGDDFAVIDVACNFQNEAFCDIPGPLGENSGFPEAPIVGWGGRIRLELDEFYVETGAYEVNPTLASPSNSWQFGTKGATGAFIPVEVGWNPTAGPFGLSGEYRLGGYYDTSDAEDVTAEVTGSDKIRSGRWGLWALAQQRVYREPGSTSRGLTVFGGFVLGDSRTAEIRWFLEGGLVYQGTFAGRDDDSVSLGVAYGHINGRLINAQKNASEVEQSGEAVIELNYAAAVTPFFQLTPNLQIVVNPGADSDVPTALVLGLRSQITF